MAQPVSSLVGAIPDSHSLARDALALLALHFRFSESSVPLVENVQAGLLDVDIPFRITWATEVQRRIFSVASLPDGSCRNKLVDGTLGYIGRICDSSPQYDNFSPWRSALRTADLGTIEKPSDC